MNDNEIKNALEVMRPNLEKKYNNYLKVNIEACLDELGEGLRHISNHWNWAPIKDVLLANCDKFLRDGFQYINRPGAAGYRFSEKKALRSSRRYSDEIIESYAAKAKSKLGALESAKLEWSSENYEFVISGVKNGLNVKINQRIKYNISKLGKAFVQFPALCYIDGKKISAAEYKKQF